MSYRGTSAVLNEVAKQHGLNSSDVASVLASPAWRSFDASVRQATDPRQENPAATLAYASRCLPRLELPVLAAKAVLEEVKRHLEIEP